MPAAPLRVPAGQPPFAAAFARVREELDVPASFPPEVEAEAEALAARGPVLPPGAPATDRVDARDIPFVAVDPPGSRDLDQAFHAERRGPGYRVRYAIADVAAFVHPGTAVDRESFQRGVTLYLPDGRAPLHPDALGEGAASLLPGVERPALLWTIDLDAAGGEEGATLRRATVRSRAALGYPEVQARIDAGTAEEPLVLLREVGTRLREREVDRGGVSLDLPTQEVVDAGGGGYALRYERPLAVEQWNEQISLLAGMAAAAVMIEAGAGLLRTLPPPPPEVLHRLERTARALGVAWPTGATWGEVVRGLDRSRADDAAFLVQATHALRGAGYTVVGPGGATTPAELVHAAVAAPYAHVTAPLRRLADRYANEVVLAACAGTAPPEWVVAALPELAGIMERTTARQGAVERAVVDAVECAVLAGHVGEAFAGVVVDRRRGGVVVQLARPAVVAPLAAEVALGEEVRVRLASVDPVDRRIELVRL
ncbi:MAG TPA: RNB domain-containing ribonuclease [Acidimicrobiales bacterium]|nr:RNB domain-containing ribonuclease [Acidimicrobiales bacterium]